MCEILVKARDNQGENNYKKHDPISLGPDGYKWGRAEGPPLFYIVNLPGINYQSLGQYFIGEYTDDEQQDVIKPRLYTWDEENGTFRNKNTNELVTLPSVVNCNQINSENTFYTATIE